MKTNRVKATDQQMAVYAKYYPEYTKASLRSALSAILSRGHRLAEPTVDHYMVEKRYGGLGYGKRRKSARWARR